MDSLPLCHLGSPQRQSKGLKHLRVYFPVDLITFCITYKVLFLKYLKCHSRFVDQLPCGSILEILQLSSNSSHETHLLQVAYQNPRSLEHELNVSFSMATLTHYFFFLTGGQLLYNAVSPCCTWISLMHTCILFLLSLPPTSSRTSVLGHHRAPTYKISESHSRGFPWWLSGKESTYKRRRHRFDPSSRKIPHVTEPLSPRVTTTGSYVWEDPRIPHATAPEACAP